MGTLGICVAPLVLASGILAAFLDNLELCFGLFKLSLMLCFVSGFVLAITSSDSWARVTSVASVSATGFILLGDSSGWFRERAAHAGPLFGLFVLALLIGILREASSDKTSGAPIYLKWGIGILLVAVVIFPIPIFVPIALVGAISFYGGLLKWTLELLAAARKVSDVEEESLAL